MNALRRHAWWLVLVAVGLAMALAAAWSPDRQKRLVDEVAEGPMQAIAADRVQRLQLQAAGRQRTLRRDGARWEADDGPVDAATVATALRLLRHTVAEREFDAEADDFGLAAPALQVAVFTDVGATAPAFAVAFGTVNPMGMARYERVSLGAQTRLVLLPAYVADTWQALAGGVRTTP